MATQLPVNALVVLLPGADPRWLGSSLLTRHGRLASRVGARLVPPADLSTGGELPAVLVPSGTALGPSLFPLAEALTTPQWLVSTGDGARVLCGPARELAAFAADLQTAAHVPATPVAPDAVMDVSSRAARWRSGRVVLRTTEKATDGWVARTCNRPISRVISHAMLGTGLSAWHASTLTLVTGLGAAISAAQPGPVGLAIAGILFHLASVIDGVDGEMARATMTESKTGARIDTIVDQTISVASLLGVAIGWIREGGGRQAFWWTIALIITSAIVLFRVGAFVSRYAPNASFVFIDRSVRRAAHASGSLLLRGAAGVFTVMRRDVYAAVFMLVSFSGRRAWVPFLVIAGAIVANVTFSMFSRELAKAGAAEAAASQ